MPESSTATDKAKLSTGDLLIKLVLQVYKTYSSTLEMQ